MFRENEEDIYKNKQSTNQQVQRNTKTSKSQNAEISLKSLAVCANLFQMGLELKELKSSQTQKETDKA